MSKKVGIICAGRRELAPFLAELKECKTTEKAMLTFNEGKIADMDAVILYSGVCKVNAAIATQVLIDFFNVDFVINAGAAGGMDPKLEICDTVVATEVAYHDVEQGILTEFHPWMESVFFKSDSKLLKAAEEAVKEIKSDKKIYFGRMVTGEAFITDEGRDKINEGFSPLSVDMETGSIAHVCYVNKVPFIAIRSITDTPSHKGSENFELNCEAAAKNAKDVTLAMLKKVN